MLGFHITLQLLKQNPLGSNLSVTDEEKPNIVGSNSFCYLKNWSIIISCINAVANAITVANTTTDRTLTHMHACRGVTGTQTVGGTGTYKFIKAGYRIKRM